MDLQHVKLVSRDRSAFRLERRGEQGQSEAEKSDIAAKVGDAVTRSKRSEFSVHTYKDGSTEAQAVQRCSCPR